jgi:hypothetical protein
MPAHRPRVGSVTALATTTITTTALAVTTITLMAATAFATPTLANPATIRTLPRHGRLLMLD